MVKFYQRVGLFTSTKATISPSTYSTEQAKKVQQNITSFNINFAGLSAAQLAQKISIITHGSAKLVTRADSKKWTKANRFNKKNIRFTPLTRKSLPLRVIFPAKKDKVELEAKPAAPLLPYLTPVIPSAQTVVAPVANRSLPPQTEDRKNPKKKKKPTKKPVKKLGVKKTIHKRRRGPVNPNAWKRKYAPKKIVKEGDAKKGEKDAKKKVGKKSEQKGAAKKEKKPVAQKKPEAKKDAPKQKGEPKKDKPAPVKKDAAKAKPEGGAKKAAPAPKPVAKKEAAKPKEQSAKPAAKKEQPKGEGKKGGEPAKKK